MNDLLTTAVHIRPLELEFKKKIEPYRSDLWRYCYKLSGSPWDAEDLVQETLLKSLGLLAKFHDDFKTKPYLFRIATNHWIDQKRKQKLQTVDSYQIEWMEEEKDPFSLVENLDFLQRNLSVKQYVSILLVDVFLFTAKEAAEIISSTPGAVYANIARARKLLKEKQSPALRKSNQDLSSKSKDKIIDRLLEGFEKKDPKLIASLLNENAVVNITHAGMEYGKKNISKNSLRDWEEVVRSKGPIIARYMIIWGKPVIVEFELKDDGTFYMENIHDITVEENQIIYWQYYCFSWDLMNAAANELNVQLNAKYFYHTF